MSEFHNQIVKIEKILTHDNAEALEIVHVLGDYPVVIRKGQFKEGDLASYICLDAVLDITRPEFNFLTNPRLKAKRLRGVYSQGLLIEAPPGFKEGDDITDYFGIKKYVYPEEMEDLQGLTEEERKKYYFPKLDANMMAKTRGGNVESPPKGWAPPYYDLDSVRKYGKLFEDGEEVIISEKIDGANGFYRYFDDRLWCKSRNLYKKRPEEFGQDLWWDIAFRYDFEKKLSKYPQYGFYGECYGQVNPFIYDCELINGRIEMRFRAFDIFDFPNGKFLDFDEMASICFELEIPIAPVIYRGPWMADKSLYALAERDTLLTPKLPQATKICEGFVVRPKHERINEKSGDRVVFKLKSERYNLAKK